MPQATFRPGSLVKARGREWVVLPEERPDVLRLRPLGGSDEDATRIYVPLEPVPPQPATFAPPDPKKAGTHEAGLLLRDALRLKLRAGAGPFRSFGNLCVEPRAYQLVPLLMALKLDTVRLLIADDVGIGKTIEAALIVRELLDRGEIRRMSVLCPPHLCDQWKQELQSKFNIHAEVVRTGTAGRLERGLPSGRSLFEAHPFTVVSLDYIKSDRRRESFLTSCPEFVVIEEAHTCVQGNPGTRHQRYQLLKGLAADPDRHMVMLTATPHSGDDEAFYNLLGLLDPSFRDMRGQTGLIRDAQREKLASHFVQRRRANIAEWKDATLFPDRHTKEETYRLTGDWGSLFTDVLAFAREMVESVRGDSILRQRMNWWAALAMLRCISSSPAAAAIAINTRLKAVEGVTEAEQIAALEQAGVETVFDGESEELFSGDETVPAAHPEAIIPESSAGKKLASFAERALKLRGKAKDPKLATLISIVNALVRDGFNPVVFCRYIATAHYVAEQLQSELSGKAVAIEAVTGELASEEREEKVAALSGEDRRILVATDCLSEGINLQAGFDAVVHYDLSWNPARHEQREGRVDRFGQRSKVVRAVMLYGDNNPVDGAVLRVILRKADVIRKELDVSVPMPTDANKVTQAIMEAVLLRKSSASGAADQLQLAFPKEEAEVDAAWASAREKAKQSNTLFAQRRMRPEEVLPEWRKAVDVLGGEEDVSRFVTVAAKGLGAPLDTGKGFFRLPIRHLPGVLREQLLSNGFPEMMKIAFSHPPAGAEHVHRAHPLVAAISNYISEISLEEGTPDIGSRCGALFTQTVTERTTVYLLRLRSQLEVIRGGDGDQVLLSEECVAVAVRGATSPVLVENADALALMQAGVARNMEPAQRERLLGEAIAAITGLNMAFETIATRRAKELLADHRRVRDAGKTKGISYLVTPCLPVDVIGVYVLMPVASF
ncbi:MAG TPA: helicase-related protein [Candidatus Deferrimicrobiaceae bacterium]